MLVNLFNGVVIRTAVEGGVRKGMPRRKGFGGKFGVETIKQNLTTDYEGRGNATRLLAIIEIIYTSETLFLTHYSPNCHSSHPVLFTKPTNTHSTTKGCTNSTPPPTHAPRQCQKWSLMNPQFQESNTSKTEGYERNGLICNHSCR